MPWSTIDMDFMNLNQSAHGDREFGYIGTRLRLPRKMVVGPLAGPDGRGTASARGPAPPAAGTTARSLRIARFGDNMREVAVTEGDKVEAQRRFGYSVNGYGVGDLARAVRDVADAERQRMVAEYDDLYEMAPTLRGRRVPIATRCVEAARIEVGLRAFLQSGGFRCVHQYVRGPRRARSSCPGSRCSA